MRRARAVLWLAALALAIAALAPFRGRLDKAHITLVLLLVVLSAAADGGRRVGIMTALLAFLGFNWFFLPPYATFVIADPLDWFVLFAFLGTSVIASHLFHRVQREADRARARAAEVSTLAALGAEAMAAPQARRALQVVATAARETLNVATCRVHVAGEHHAVVGGAALQETSPSAARTQAGAMAATVTAGAGDDALLGDEVVRLALDRAAPVAVLEGGVVRVVGGGEATLAETLAGLEVRRVLLPLRRGTQAVGVLDLDDARGVPVSGERQRLLTALAYYAALGAERLQLEGAAQQVEALREADRMRSAVLASVSHDLRTPLTTIKALAHEMGALGDERSEVIEHEADRLNRFVGDMLDLSRLASGHVPLQVTVTPLDELLSAALQQIQGSYGGRHVDVRLPPGEALPLARFDLTHAVRILVNLLENARKYAPGESPVEVWVERAGDMQAIHVADRGPGVPAEESERIFEALYRPPSARVDQGSAGLGLSIARGLAEAQGGTLTYAPRPGGGSVFTLRLPAADLGDIDGD